MLVRHLRNSGFDVVFISLGEPNSEEVMERQIKSMAVLALMILSAVFVCITDASAQIYDRPYAASIGQTQQSGYNNGYRDGVARGQHEGRENDPFDYHTPDWRQATRGYQPWMGPVSVFQQGYQEGYASGFRAGFVSVRPGWREGDGDDFRPTSYPGDHYSANVGYTFGRQDGAEAAREDLYHNKPFNPNPRGRYGSMDHGYQRDYGDKGHYKSQYDAGYHNGYDAVFNRRY
jgi:hypothetical protein